MTIFSKIKPVVCLVKLGLCLPLIVPVLWLWYPLGVPETLVLIILAYVIVSGIEALWRVFRKRPEAQGSQSASKAEA